MEALITAELTLLLLTSVHSIVDDAGVNVVTLTAWDAAGNSSSATANVTILDTLSPIILANHDTIFLDSFGQAILTSSAIDAGTFDNCTLLYTDVSDSLFGCSDVNNAHLVWVHCI